MDWHDAMILLHTVWCEKANAWEQYVWNDKRLWKMQYELKMAYVCDKGAMYENDIKCMWNHKVSMVCGYYELHVVLHSMSCIQSNVTYKKVFPKYVFLMNMEKQIERFKHH